MLAFLFVAVPFVQIAFSSGEHPAGGQADTGAKMEKGHGEKIHWDYEGPGAPENWGDIEAEFSACKMGKAQSPIDITFGREADLHGIRVAYKATNLEILNNGHTIQVNYKKGSFIEVNSKPYDLLQFHFHSPSEHKLHGKAFPMEAHLVHKGEEGLAVIGIFITEGRENPFLKDIWTYLPKKGGDQHSEDVLAINASEFLPENRSYVHYYGSLTTPPCSEGVKWMVMNTTVEASKAQIAQFREIIHGNARPVQPHNSRIIETKK